MALSVENALNVRNRVFAALDALNQGTSAGSGDASAHYMFKSFFLNHASNKGNPDLQFLPVTAATAIAGDGQDHGVDEACQLYAVYIKKGTSATDSYYKLFDDADNDSEEVADLRVELALLEAGDIAIAFYPNGLPMAAGVVSTFTTTAGDTSTQSSAAADAGNGFIIVGRA